ncbi:MAG: hypothetical protein A2X54_09935 [Nitrospirae bacterium GWF2_44_13]|nr:MAG: hypothetical protein A2X54_09935 [Nitrospirae bacterium GWF2_44_13]OGW33790.1 MAG: hypothetical protein A2088_07065 [Nitrospirae bacterium GWD2_44_7]OGW63425.1 MAG: hypothetical protein A2222_06285 [Nitrospirae bacterium RIFOXYA2_FULL_44_9]HBG91945.1 hypothetical protein [Nitrospiraceae bacterium]HBU05337.1 hypothetical protein [Nitrospiraceae bacterium]
MKPFTKIAIAVFSLVAVLHLLRLVFGLEVVIDGVIIPFWVSVIGFIAAGVLAVLLWRETRI